MAKLSAHGTELARVSKQWPLRQNVIDATVVIHVKILMSDGVVLEKHTFQRATGATHRGGWKKVGKIKPEFATAERWLALQRIVGFVEVQ